MELFRGFHDWLADSVVNSRSELSTLSSSRSELSAIAKTRRRQREPTTPSPAPPLPDDLPPTPEPAGPPAAPSAPTPAIPRAWVAVGAVLLLLAVGGVAFGASQWAAAQRTSDDGTAMVLAPDLGANNSLLAVRFE